MNEAPEPGPLMRPKLSISTTGVLPLLEISKKVCSRIGNECSPARMYGISG